ncbi:MAG TPA: PorV/PorQ family protein [bacterium]
MHLWQTHRFKKLSLPFLLLAIALTSSRVFAQESAGSPGAFLSMGVGARPLGLGSAYVGLAEGPAATYWNPSGLGRIHNFQFEFMNTNLPFDRTFNFFSGILPVKNILTLGLSWAGLRVNNIEGRTSNTEQPVYNFGSSQNVVALSMGKALTSFLSIGGNVKFIKYDLDSQSATGVGFDAGLLFRPAELFSVGLMAQDLATDYRWNGSTTETVPMTYRAGIALNVYRGLVLVADVNKAANLSPRINFGGEFRPAFFLPLRVGYHDDQISGGAGIIMPFSAHSMEFNYSYANDRIFDDAVHQISLVFSFGSHSPARAKTRDARPAYTPKVETVSPPQLSSPERVAKRPKIVSVSAALLNVRSGPGVKHGKIAQIKIGQKFNVLDEANSWLKIKIGSGRVGWVHSDYVKMLD